jgi:sulfofructose kinase
MNDRPRVICLGLSALDATWNVERLPAGGGKTLATGFHQGGGGMAATAAVAAARLGAEVEFWGRAGDDAAGHAMRAELAQWSVDVRHFRLFDGARSSVSGVIVDARGERTIVNFRGADQPADAAWLPLDCVAHAGAVLADPRWPEGALALFEAARRHGVPSVLDGDVADGAVFDALLPHTDHAVFSEPGLAGYVDGTHDTAHALQAALAHGCRVAAVTLGERGLAWDDGTGLQRLPAFPVEVVDTNGAGDVFHGALAFALGRRQPLRDALRFSSAVAALKCTRAGGRDGVPDLASAMSFLKDSKE